jgi:hypothetical protein
MARATRWVPPDTRRGGRPAHVSNLYRWALDGLRGVKLETIRVGGTLCTSREALERFFDRLDEAARTNAGRGEISDRRKREMEEASRKAKEALR